MSSRRLTINRSACVSIVAAAVEVFPKECMGCICCNQQGKINAAFSYQIARRKAQQVTSTSAEYFDKLFPSGSFSKLGDFHSHTYQHFEKLDPLEPSKTDLDQLKIGGIEIIIQIKRTRSNLNKWQKSKDRIKIALGRYRCMIAAFMRIKGIDIYGVPLYKEVSLNLDGNHERKMRPLPVKLRNRRKQSRQMPSSREYKRRS